MPSTNKTSTLNLNQWLATDKPVMADFNNDNQILDNFIAGGIPRLMASGEFEIVAGCIRQDPANRAHWNFLNDTEHQCNIGVSDIYATASGSQITINFAKTYSKVIAFVAGPDETFANVYGMSVGASVGLSSAVLKISGLINGAGFIRYDGTNWVLSQDAGQQLIASVANISYNAGDLTVVHGFCPGKDLTLTPYMYSIAYPPYVPSIRSLTNTQFIVNFQDWAGARIAGSAVPNMAFFYRKSYQEGWYVDGTNGYDAIPMEIGDIWFKGLFKV